MPIIIGAVPESGFSNPIGLLSDCHRRIELFLNVLSRVGEEHGGILSGEHQAALDTALRYFREAAPKHTADEEQSLFPRLRRLESPEVRSILARVDSLEDDHVRASSLHDEVDRLGQSWLNSGRLTATESERFDEVLALLHGLYQDHIATEDREVFPAAAALLSPSDRIAIGTEMAGRRGLANVIAR